MSEFIALDFVVVPEEPIFSQAVEWNRNYCDSSISLGYRMVPHISFLMIYAKKSDIDSILTYVNSSELQSMIEKIPFQFKNPSSLDVGMNQKILSWGIEKIDNLTELQDKLIHKFSHFSVKDNFNKNSSFYQKSVNDSTIQWTDNYLNTSTGSNFDPHITLGFLNHSLDNKNPKDLSSSPCLDPKNNFPIIPDHLQKQNFHFSRIQVYQLGNYCTCRLNLMGKVSDKLVENYKNTDYFILRDQNILIELDKLNPKLDKLLSIHGKESWAFLTAWNPRSKPGSPNENLFRNQELLKYIKEEKNWKYYPAVGRERILEGKKIGDRTAMNGKTWEEESFFILGMGREEAIQLAAFFEQNGFLYGEKNTFAKLYLTNECI